MPPRSRRSTQSGPVPVESIQHGDKRINLPTADAQEFVTPEIADARHILLQRDITQDPQLVWRGKYGDGTGPETDQDLLDAAELAVDAPPIYIQEKIDPRVLIENLRRTAKEGEQEPEFTLFDTFDGLGPLDNLEFYTHSANWSNRMILGDSLQVMASLAEREDLRGTVQMVYIDPPYGIKFGSNWQASARSRDVKDGKMEDAAREAEQIKAFRDTWELGIHSYLSYLRDRLVVARELLTETGSCFVQIGDENVHLVRSLMDEVFGVENFISQIVFRKTSSATSRYLPPTADHIVWFARDIDVVKYRLPLAKRDGLRDADASYAFVETSAGRRRLDGLERAGISALPADSRVYRQQILTSPRVRSGRTGFFPVQVDDKEYWPTTGEWKTNAAGMKRLVTAGRVLSSGRTLSYIRYLDDFPAVAVTNLWDDTQSGSGMDKIYVVQSSSKVIERCMLMCTDPGDLVIDPTCGSGTTAFVAEQWGRRWITIDTSRVALALARQRLMGAKYPYYLKADSSAGRKKLLETTGQEPPTSAPSDDIRHGFVYERVQHITLKSIANNPDIREGMSRAEIDAAIKRHADYELLYDKPYEDNGVVRVTGPFTVESLSPHRSLAFSTNPDSEGRESISEQLGAEQPDAANFEQSVLANLAKAGIQNGRRNERIHFESVEPYAGTYIQAIGTRKPSAADRDTGGGDGLADGAGPRVRIGIALGPQYGTVGQRFAADAVKEAVAAGSIDLLVLLAFAFDPTVVELTEADGVTVDASRDGFASVDERTLGPIKLLFVKMNVDLLMGDALKKTGAGNLFTVFGEPDISIDRSDDGEVVVTLNGVDVYDPTTDEIRSNDTDHIALWMIDTDYNGDAFFVRHCYFTGGGDPYKRLKTALKAEIDAEAWASMNSTVSRPFPVPSTGQIAVKVINDYGDEVMKVFEIAAN